MKHIKIKLYSIVVVLVHIQVIWSAPITVEIEGQKFSIEEDILKESTVLKDITSDFLSIESEQTLEIPHITIQEWTTIVVPTLQIIHTYKTDAKNLPNALSSALGLPLKKLPELFAIANNADYLDIQPLRDITIQQLTAYIKKHIQDFTIDPTNFLEQFSAIPAGLQHDIAVVLQEELVGKGTFKKYAELEQEIDAVYHVALHPTKPLLIVTGKDVIKIWNISNIFNPALLSQTHVTKKILDLHVDAEKDIVALGIDKGLELWNIAHQEKPLRSTAITSLDDVNAVALHGNIMAYGSGTKLHNHIFLSDISDPKNPKPLSTLPGHTQYIRALAFDLSGHHLVSAEHQIDPTTQPPLPEAQSQRGNTIKLWDITNPQLPRVSGESSEHLHATIQCIYNPSGTLLASLSRDKTVKLWSPNNVTQSLGTIALIPEPTAAVFSNDTTLLVGTGLNLNAIIAFDVANPVMPKELYRIDKTNGGHTAWITSLAVNKDGTLLASASGAGDKTIKLWGQPPRLSFEQMLLVTAARLAKIKPDLSNEIIRKIYDSLPSMVKNMVMPEK